MVSRQAVIDEARTWVGMPWQHQAFTKGLAADCIGLIGGVALELGLPGAEQWRDTPAFHNYGRQPNSELLLAGAELLMDPIDPAHAEIADVLLFRFKRDPQHFALVSRLDPLYVVHSHAGVHKVTENIIDEKWRKRIVGAYHLRGVE